jgi:membrane-bound ClpP family serine protease
MEVALIILFLIVGLIFLLVEILVTPGIVLGVIGIGFMSFGVFKSYTAYGTFIGNIVLVSTFAVTIFIVFLALKGGVWKRMASKNVISGKAHEDVKDLVSIGDAGKTLSALRPSGTAVIGGKKVEVHTQGEPIDSSTEVVVINISRNKILVKQS